MPLTLVPVTPWLDGPLWPMVFDTSMGVRKEDRALRRELNASLQRHACEIAAILDEYHVPRVEAAGTASPRHRKPQLRVSFTRRTLR